MGFDYNAYLESRADVCGGALVVKGTRVLVRTLLASFAEGDTEADIRADFPTVTPDALRAVIALAASAANNPDSERAEWTALGMQELARAYGNHEPRHTAADVVSPWPKVTLP